MSYTDPAPGRYRRIKDGAIVQVLGSTGTSGMSDVSVKGARHFYVRLENFWKKYEPAGEETQR